MNWYRFTLKIEYGYFGSWYPIEIECDDEGHLEFTCGDISHLPPLNTTIVDKQLALNGKGLKEANQLVKDLLNCDPVDQRCVMDGGSFEFLVHLKNNRLQGFSLYHAFKDEGLNKKLDRLRELLHEEYFLEKYGKDISR